MDLLEVRILKLEEKVKKIEGSQDKPMKKVAELFAEEIKAGNAEIREKVINIIKEIEEDIVGKPTTDKEAQQ